MPQYKLCYKGSSVNPDCPQCPYGKAAIMRINLGSLSNDGCADCDAIPTTIDLVNNDGTCQWYEDPMGSPNILCYGSFFISLNFHVAHNQWELLFVGGTGNLCSTAYGMSYVGAARYVMSEAAFNCLGTNNMPLECSNDSCSGWPDPITVSAL